MSLSISNNSVSSICGLLISKGLLKQESFDQANNSSSNSGKNIFAEFSVIFSSAANELTSLINL